MEDIVAVKVTDDAGKSHYFITWGRIFSPVDPEPLLQAITPNLAIYGIDNFTDIHLCPTLREASSQLHFYEALFSSGQKKIPLKNAKDYERWRKKQKREFNTARRFTISERSERLKSRIAAHSVG